MGAFGRFRCCIFLLLVLLAACDSGSATTLDVTSANVATAQIGAGGGVLASKDGLLTLTIPSGALGSEQTIGIEAIPASALSAAFRALRPRQAYRLTPDGLQFASPVQLTFASTQPVVAGSSGVLASIPIVVTESGGVIQTVAQTGVFADTLANALPITAEITHFSDIAVVDLANADSPAGIDVSLTYPPETVVSESGTLRMVIRPQPSFLQLSQGTTLVAVLREVPDGAFMQFEGAQEGSVIILARVGELIAGTGGTISATFRCVAAGEQLIEVTMSLEQREGGLVVLADGSAVGAAAPPSQRATYRAQVRVRCVAQATNRPPLAVEDSFQTQRDRVLTVTAPGIIANDSDPDGNPLQAIRITRTRNGTIVSAANGSFTYTPNPGFVGTDTFDYFVDDGTSGSNLAVVTIHVLPPNAPPLAGNDSYETAYETTLDVAAPGVLANDTDPEGGALTAELQNPPAAGTLTLNPNGSFRYVPPPGFEGTVPFTYRARDGAGSTTTATVTITVRPRVCMADPQDTQLATASIGSAGGSIRSTDQQLTVTFPPGALSVTQLFCLRRLLPASTAIQILPARTLSVYELFPNVALITAARALVRRGAATLLRPDGALSAPIQIPFVGPRDGELVPGDGIETTGEASANDVRTEFNLSELGVIALPGDPEPEVGEPELGHAQLQGATSAVVEQTQELEAAFIPNGGFFEETDVVEVRLLRIGAHGPEQIDFGAFNDGAFQRMPLVFLGYFQPIPFTCHQIGAYPVIAEMRLTADPTTIYGGSVNIGPIQIALMRISLDLSCTGPGAMTTYIDLTDKNIGAVESMTVLPRANLRFKSAGPADFPVPNGNAESLPVFVAGMGRQGASGFPSSVVAVDAVNGNLLYSYSFAGESTWFDVLPLQPPSDDPDIDRKRELFAAGRGAGFLSIFPDGTEGAAFLLNPQDAVYTDSSYAAGTTIAFTTTGPFVGVRFFAYGFSQQAGETRFFERRNEDFSFAVPTTLVTNARSAAANADGSRILVVEGAGTQTPGALHLVDRSGSAPMASAVGTLGSNPQRIRCGELIAPLTQVLCAISDIADHTVQLLSWDLQGPPTLGPVLTVGQGPVGLDVFDHRVAVAGFDDNSFSIVTVDPADPLAANPAVVTTPIASIAAIAACTRPGHAAFMRDPDRRVALSCNGSAGIAVIASAYNAR